MEDGGVVEMVLCGRFVYAGALGKGRRWAGEKEDGSVSKMGLSFFW